MHGTSHRREGGKKSGRARHEIMPSDRPEEKEHVRSLSCAVGLARAEKIETPSPEWQQEDPKAQSAGFGGPFSSARGRLQAVWLGHLGGITRDLGMYLVDTASGTRTVPT